MQRDLPNWNVDGAFTGLHLSLLIPPTDKSPAARPLPTGWFVLTARRHGFRPHESSRRIVALGALRSNGSPARFPADRSRRWRAPAVPQTTRAAVRDSCPSAIQIRANSSHE